MYLLLICMLYYFFQDKIFGKYMKKLQYVFDTLHYISKNVMNFQYIFINDNNIYKL